MVIVSILVRLIDLYTLVIFVYVLMSWIPRTNRTFSQIYDVLGRICDPYLNLFRRFIPPIGGMVDISPVVAIIALILIERVLYIIF